MCILIYVYLETGAITRLSKKIKPSKRRLVYPILVSSAASFGLP